MGCQSLFDVVENIEKPNDSTNALRPRSPFPAEFKGSPYLTSPIRPIPTLKLPKRSKKSPRRIKKGEAIERSTIVPPRNKAADCQSSDHLESLRYHANSHSVSKTKVQPQQLCILLPDEIDDLAKLFGTKTLPTSDLNVERDHFCKDEREQEEKVNESSDDESTLNSDFAASLDENTILELDGSSNDNTGLAQSYKSIESERANINLSIDHDTKEARKRDETRVSSPLSNASQILKLPFITQA